MDWVLIYMKESYISILLSFYSLFLLSLGFAFQVRSMRSSRIKPSTFQHVVLLRRSGQLELSCLLRLLLSSSEQRLRSFTKARQKPRPFKSSDATWHLESTALSAILFVLNIDRPLNDPFALGTSPYAWQSIKGDIKALQFYQSILLESRVKNEPFLGVPSDD